VHPWITFYLKFDEQTGYLLMIYYLQILFLTEIHRWFWTNFEQCGRKKSWSVSRYYHALYPDNHEISLRITDILARIQNGHLRHTTPVPLG
jgi:hypothetical protein